MRAARLLLALTAAALLPSPRVHAAVHLYNGVFTPLNDAFVFRAGREGMFRSHRDTARGSASHAPRCQA